MQQSVIAIFDSFWAATSAARDLNAYGFEPQQIQIAAKTSKGTFWYRLASFNTGSIHNSIRIHEAANSSFLGAGIFATAGIIGGLVLSPELANQMSTMASSVVGAAAFGLVGGLIGLAAARLSGTGMPADEALQYADTVRQGKVFVVVRAERETMGLLRDILGNYHPNKMEGPATAADWQHWMRKERLDELERALTETQEAAEHT